MKTRLKYLFIVLGMLSTGLFCSCEEEEHQSVENLCSGYWYRPADSSAPMMQFDHDGGVHYWIWRYEPDEGLYYAWNDTGMDGRYAIDANNSTFCLLPDDWYDIYILSAGIFTLDNGHGGNIKMANLSADKVTVLTESLFKQKYLDTYTDTGTGLDTGAE